MAPLLNHGFSGVLLFRGKGLYVRIFQVNSHKNKPQSTVVNYIRIPQTGNWINIVGQNAEGDS